MPANLGKWDIVLASTGCVADTQQEAVHACVIYNPNEDKWKVLYFTAIDNEGSGNVKTRIWDPNSVLIDPISSQNIPNWLPPPPDPPDNLGRIFCAGHCFLADGKLLVGGGHRPVPTGGPWARGMPFTYIFDPVTGQWSVAGLPGPRHDMADGRWYPTLTKLGGVAPNDKKVVAITGYRYEYKPVGPPNTLWYNETVEIYNPGTGPGSGWTLLPPAANTPQPFIDNEVLYPSAHLIPYNNGNIQAGEIFYCMPLAQSYRFNPDGLGNPSPYWNTMPVSSQFRGNGSSVLLPLPENGSSAKVILLGGSIETDVLPTTSVDIIDLKSPSPVWSALPNMYIPRKHANAVILANGNVLVVGGTQMRERETSVTVPELLDVDTGTWSIIPAHTYPRMYHSTAILLPDGRVLASGGESLCQAPEPSGVVYKNFELYSPGYLFEGTRPNITFPTSWPLNIFYNTNFSITTDLAIDKILLIRLGVPTHAFDQNQRAAFLYFTSGPSNGGIPHTVTAPSNGNILPPGYYMMFVLRPKSASSSGQLRIPSVAKWVRIS